MKISCKLHAIDLADHPLVKGEQHVKETGCKCTVWYSIGREKNHPLFIVWIPSILIWVNVQGEKYSDLLVEIGT